MQNPTPEQLTKVAEKIAKSAGEIATSFLKRDKNTDHKELNIENKSGHRDIVTAADKACETHIIAKIRELHAAHQILGEEGQGHELGQKILDSDEPVWIIDPIDGTTNFSHGHPFFAVSIGIAKRSQQTGQSELIAGVIHAPLLNQTFTTWKNGGAFQNGTPIHVSNTDQLQKALLATGFNSRYDLPNIHHFTHLLPITQGIRRCGAASLDLAYVACGILDGFWEKGLMPWDMAAGILMIQEAGGTVTNLNGNPYNLFENHLLAANPEIHKSLLQYFKDIQL